MLGFLSTLFNLVAIVLAVGVAYAVASDPREPVARLPGGTRFGVFVVVAGGAALLFHDLLSMIAPALTGSLTTDALINFVVGVVLIAFVGWFYLKLGESPSALIERLPGARTRE